MAKIRIYENKEVMLQEYTARYARPLLKFEGCMYSFIGERRKGELKYHLYRCDDEQHYLLVHMRHDLPFLIKPFHSIPRIILTDIWDFVEVQETGAIQNN